MRVAVLCDLVEEGWPSMDLVADALLEGLRAHSPAVQATRIRPMMRRRFSAGAADDPEHRPGRLGRIAWNSDRLLNRLWDYPRHARSRRAAFDVFHVVDHSYAQLVHQLPAKRAVVTCHDLDTFRAVLEPDQEPRPALFRAMSRHILDGMRKAARVICVSEATRGAILAHRLIPEGKVVVIPNGVDPSCTAVADPAGDAEALRLLGAPEGVEILHVGSTIPRKGIDVLLRVFAQVRAKHPEARLLRVGGPFTAEQENLARDLGVGGAITMLPFLDRAVLAAVYRRATVLLQPSSAEGFGLPLVEALSCGTPVIASDLAVLREVGGAAAIYCPVGGVGEWAAAVEAILEERCQRPDAWEARRSAGLDHASSFSWQESVRRTVEVYRQVLNEVGPVGASA